MGSGTQHQARRRTEYKFDQLKIIEGGTQHQARVRIGKEFVQLKLLDNGMYHQLETWTYNKRIEYEKVNNIYTYI